MADDSCLPVNVGESNGIHRSASCWTGKCVGKLVVLRRFFDGNSGFVVFRAMANIIVHVAV